MLLHFFKYQATGNDFIIIDNNDNSIPETNAELIKYLCNRHFGIGADGLIVYKKHDYYDFEMLYFNSDGNSSTLCGNGARCITLFAYERKYIEKSCKFLASDGPHFSEIVRPNFVKLKLQDVVKIMKHNDGYEIVTGSPHFVISHNHELKSIDVNKLGKEIRNNQRFKEKGINVNFVQIIDNNVVNIRTYERGVEAETLSCGTGSVASAIFSKIDKIDGEYTIKVLTLGGELTVSFTKKNNTFSNIYLIGEAKKVFEGKIKI